MFAAQKVLGSELSRNEQGCVMKAGCAKACKLLFSVNVECDIL